MLALTNFGDTAVLLPLSVFLLLWLAIARSTAAALWWLAVVVASNGALILLKLYSYECAPLPDLKSPSGHTGFSTLAYGALAFVVAVEQQSALRRVGIGLACAVLVLGIAASRVLLKEHTVPEVIVGLLVGLAGFTVFARGYPGRRRGRSGGLIALTIGAVAVIVLFHGNKLNAEETLHLFGSELHLGVVCGR